MKREIREMLRFRLISLIEINIGRLKALDQENTYHRFKGCKFPSKRMNTSSQRRNNNNHRRAINSEHPVNVSGIRVYIHLSTVRRFMNATIEYNIFELIVISISINNRFLFKRNEVACTRYFARKYVYFEQDLF